jgi:glutamate racemase
LEIAFTESTLNHNERPIGVFDSGVGGLTVLRALRAQLPNEHFVYLGDTARLPYGTKSRESIERYALQAASSLINQRVKCLVIACNTASAVALELLSSRLSPLPVIGVVAPGAEAGCRASRSGRIAVIATEGTVRGGAYERAIGSRRADARVIARACPLFVALAEEGLIAGPIVEAIAHHYLDDIFSVPDSQRPDTLVLGCTHFPVLTAAMAKVVGEQIVIVDSALTAAVAVEQELIRGGLRRQGVATGQSLSGHALRLLATDGRERFARVGGIFLGQALDPHDVELIDLGV